MELELQAKAAAAVRAKGAVSTRDKRAPEVVPGDEGRRGRRRVDAERATAPGRRAGRRGGCERRRRGVGNGRVGEVCGVLRG